MDQPEPYTYTDPSDDTLTIDRISNVVTLEARQGDQAAGIHVLFEDVEQVVAAIRTAAGAQACDRCGCSPRCCACDFTAAGAQQPEPEERPGGETLRERMEREQPEAMQNSISESGDATCSACGARNGEHWHRCPDRASAREDLQRERYADAILAALARDTTNGPDWGAAADAAMAVADEEQQTLLAMLQAERGQADGIIRRLRAELGQARGTTGQDTTVPADGEQQIAELTDADRQFLRFALDEAADRMYSSDGFTDDDEAALSKLRRLAADPEPTA